VRIRMITKVEAKEDKQQTSVLLKMQEENIETKTCVQRERTPFKKETKKPNMNWFTDHLTLWRQSMLMK
jgi:hypothetical protein